MQDKPWHDSKTIVSAIFFVGATLASHFFPEQAGTIATIIQGLAGLGIIYGFRDVIGKKK